MKSVMVHNFSQVPQVNIQRSTFNRTHGYKTTFNAGYLVPFFIDEVLPGDTFNCRASIFARLSTPVAPIMDNMRLETFFFFVPTRLIWNNWQRFNGEQDNPGDSTDFLVPQIVSPPGGWAPLSLSDYFGLPTRVGNLSVCSFWHRAYNLIWNEWFRDQNLQDSVPVPKDDGPDADTNFVLLRRGKRHDYFTSCLPFPQKGPAVEIPLGDMAPVISSPSSPMTGAVEVRTADGSNPGLNSFMTVTSGGQLGYNSQGSSSVASGLNFRLHADLSDATAATINSLRQAFQIQRMFERDARGGSRYTEIVRSHFGVISPDARLQRPEYLGGGSAPIIINPVTQTSSTDSNSPQGNLAAFGLVSDSGHGFTKSFTEHGVVIGLVNVRADINYQQGINRMFSRRTRFDFYWPSLAHLGEQVVLNKEIFAQGNADDDKVFGYQERYAEYRYKPSVITGKFRSTDPQPLDFWHLAQKFENLPVLNSEFIEDKPPIDRVVAVPSEPHFILDSFFDLKCARPMPIYSVPGLIDHF